MSALILRSPSFMDCHSTGVVAELLACNVTFLKSKVYPKIKNQLHPVIPR